MPRCYVIDLWTSYDDGSPSELVTVDLVGFRGFVRKQRLRSLGDEILGVAEPVVGWRPGAEGAWIRFPLGGGDTVFAQWREDAELPWRTTRFRLKIVRMLGRDECDAFLTSVPPAG